MPKVKTMYACSECGYETPRWYGKCPDCGAWNSLNEYIKQPERAVSAKALPLSPSGDISSYITAISQVDERREIRRDTGMPELNRVLGGGAVDGSAVLLSGDPGIGKSTLLLQICMTLCESCRVLYAAGEESPRQIKLRASRIGLDSDNLFIADITDIENVVHAVRHIQPDVVMVDSIQSMNHASVSSSSGSVTQVRECAQVLIHLAKGSGIPVFIVGHVNKDGGIAGPKVLEHMVDVVLTFEGERHSSYRILRAVKNRFGSTNEIGVFEMGEKGLADVDNPSLMLLSGRPSGVSGTCVACVMEGSRPILAEVQALVSKTSFGTPRRVSTGFDFGRSALLVAVLEKRANYFFGNLDAYINIIGGLRLDEPGADLPVALALVSNLLDHPVPEDLAAFGEVGLAGEVRAVSHAQQRINECARLGFTRIIVPSAGAKNLIAPHGTSLLPVSRVAQAIAKIQGKS
ncbi:MAG: DNA repair protein RadA [Oscillospiraceae bacterium]|nr:DNA repair protein RadA [Oscillospiraceae bacterium]